MTILNYLAFDFGAQSARAIHGKLEDKRLKISEIYRFATGGMKVGDTLRWNILQFFEETKRACKIFGENVEGEIGGLGVDSWGVDYVLLDEAGQLVSLPYHYRDKRTNNIYEEVFRIVPKEEIYRRTGIQFMQINSLFQLYSMIRAKDPDLRKAKKFLHIADFFHYLFTRKIACEYTLATTSQLYDFREQNWAFDLIEKLGIKSEIFPEIVPHSTVLGGMIPEIAREVKLRDCPIIAPAAHDTGAAIAAVPATHSDFVYISSGTWSLLGAELEAPFVNDASLSSNFTNEGGVFGTIRFLKNISGLWILAECKRRWDQIKRCSYEDLNREALEAKPFQSFIDPDYSLFLNPDNMIKAIQQFCKMTHQRIPNSRGEIVRCILESLALKYKYVYEKLRKILKRNFKTIHIIGGGSQNKLLSQFTANGIGIEVRTGPVEATAVGNILTQLASQSHNYKLFELRKIVINSFPIEKLAPQETTEWDEAYKIFLKYMKS
ncbi:MAG: rhamnulokinase [Candidatus Helarchaeota archaeon]|nr:rhamnulokinase [Deltaproteobacteria bacterium]